MQKFVSKITPLLFLLVLMSGCSMETTIKGEFLLDNSFKLVKEFEDGQQCQEEDKWFSSTSVLLTNPNETYELVLQYKNGEKKEFGGEYKIFVGTEGHSGEGYFFLDDIKSDLEFEQSYFLIFALPTRYNPVGCETTHILHFQRWQL